MKPVITEECKINATFCNQTLSITWQPLKYKSININHSPPPSKKKKNIINHSTLSMKPVITEECKVRSRRGGQDTRQMRNKQILVASSNSFF